VAAEGEGVSLSDADAYDRFMGRYSRPLAVPFADFAGLPLDGRVLDVGCGPGALTAELARRARPGRVTAVDPSEEFVAALRGRHPGVQVVRAPAQGVLYPDDGITKGDLFEYYRQVGPAIVPHLKDRPFTMKRYPHGIDGEVFFQKQAPKGMPDWIPTRQFRTLPREGGPRLVDFPLVN